MFRLIALLIALPSLAAAEWSPTPAFFAYDATFERCKMEPYLPDPAAACESFLADAYVLKRAVALAYQRCGGESIVTCTAPFEEEGLPAIAAGIAYDGFCEEGDLSVLPANQPLHADHCVSLIASILQDEGLVPLDNALWCDSRATDCFDIQTINTTHWVMTVQDMGRDNPDILTRLQEGLAACPASVALSAENTPGVALGVLELDCRANLAAALWKEQAQKDGEDH